MQNYTNYSLDIILNGLTGTNTAVFLTCIILLVFIAAFILLAFMPEKRAYIANRTPGILTTLGLAGTFLRIAQNFDSDLPALLENIKLSIWTAILGMTCAIIITFINYLTGIFADDVNNDSEIMILVAESIEDSVNAMQQSMLEHSKKISSTVQSLGQGINDVAKLSQALPKVIANLDKVIESSMKKIRDSLQNQPGNIDADFKEVESAMKKQINQISEITAKLAAAGDSITKYADKITDSLKEQLPQITESITGILQAQSGEISAITQNLSDKINDSLQEQLPRISESITGILQTQSEKISAITQNLSNYADSINDSLQAQMPRISESITEILQTQSQEIAEASGKILASNLTEHEKRVGAITKSLDNELSKQQELMSKIALNLESILTTGVQNIESEFTKSSAKINNILNRNVKTLDENTEKYLNHTLKIFADNLAAIIKKIMDDINTLSGGRQ